MNWENVFLLKKLETDVDIADDWHGNDGPIKVRRVPEEHWTSHSKAMFETFKRAKYKYLPDQTVILKVVFPVTISNFDEKNIRGHGYLTPEIRKRKNLTISTKTVVTELLLKTKNVLV